MATCCACRWLRQVVKIGTTVAAALVALSAPALAYAGGNASGQPMTAQSVPAFLQDIVPLEVIGLTDDQRLVRFNTIVPGLPLNGPRVSGLQGDATVIGIDYRVQNNLLYGVGNAGGIYTLNPGNGNATKVSQLSVPLAGTSFGVDVNPAANRLRVISDTGQNLRHNIDDPSGLPAVGTTAVDAALTTPPAAGPATGVTAAGYTNNDLAATTGTTLFDSPQRHHGRQQGACDPSGQRQLRAVRGEPAHRRGHLPGRVRLREQCGGHRHPAQPELIGNHPVTPLG